MSWVILALRKQELKRAHSDYVAQELQISRQTRAEARRYHYEQLLVRNDQNEKLDELKSIYNNSKDEINDRIKALKATVDSENEGKDTKDKISYNEFYDTEGKSLAEYNTMLNEAQENYQQDVMNTKTYWEEELAMIEEEANDTETMLEEQKVEIETLMEAISQEIQAVDQAISTEVQNSTIKLS